MKDKKCKGFTLVELIVVIAIIGVLAAILVPSLLGYVKKSKVTAANSNAKSLYNACVTALTELNVEGVSANDPTIKAGEPLSWAESTNTKSMNYRIQNYFSGVKNFVGDGKFAVYQIDENLSTVQGVAIRDGNYTGTSPKAALVDAGSAANGDSALMDSSSSAISWAIS